MADLTDEQLEGMSMWDRDVMLDERHRAVGAMLVQMAVAEIRRRRAAQLPDEDFTRIQATRDEMARFEFLDEIPELLGTLDRVLATRSTP